MTQNDFDLDDYPIVVAIDIGTHFSSCAYAHIDEVDDMDVRIVSTWPKQIAQCAKTPTLNLYEKVGSKYKMVEWGWKSKLKMESPLASKYTQVYQYKPHLDENQALGHWKYPVTVSDAISDYLKAFHEYVAEKILQEFGKSYSRHNFRYCLTVPAMWSDRAKDVMRRAAIRANLVTESDHPNRLMLVSEPEAAALYCQRACKQFELEDHERFMICDAGGITVDLIVYETVMTPAGTRLSEVTKGHGATCGSIFIDLNLENLLIKKFGEQGSKFSKDVILGLVDKFAYELKPIFDGDEDLNLALPRNDCFYFLEDPGSIGINGDGSYMRLKALELKKVVFDPVVKKVLALIQNQLDGAKSCQAIFMVGGFGTSSYLLKCIREEFGGTVRIISAPRKPEIAAVCGAVYARCSMVTNLQTDEKSNSTFHSNTSNAELQRQVQILKSQMKDISDQLEEEKDRTKQISSELQTLQTQKSDLEKVSNTAHHRNQQLYEELEELKSQNTRLAQDNMNLNRKYDMKAESHRNLSKEYMDLVRPIMTTNYDYATIHRDLVGIRVSIENLVQRAKGIRSSNMKKEAVVQHFKSSGQLEGFPIPEDDLEPYHLSLYIESAIMSVLMDSFFSRPLECIFDYGEKFKDIYRWVDERDSKVSTRWRQQLCVLAIRDTHAMNLKREQEVTKAVISLSRLVRKFYSNVDMSSTITELCYAAFDLSFGMFGMESLITPVSIPLGMQFDNESMDAAYDSNMEGDVSLVIIPAFKGIDSTSWVKPKVWCK
ncbi:hypothetical protein BGX27_010114 [Mortierella sp. AM989]|nr:hypothetical protein BGX27_010114 [Mortierella sp. AM989]